MLRTERKRTIEKDRLRVCVREILMREREGVSEGEREKYTN